MRSDRRNYKKCVILIQEIFGVNKHIHFYEEKFCKMGFDVVIPYLIDSGKVVDYEDERNAYMHYMSHIGFEKSKNDVETVIHDLSLQYDEIHLVGFGVGATTAWLCSANNNVKSIMGFYGANIKDYLMIEPTREVLLVYSDGETAFNPYEIQAGLRNKPRVKTEIINGSHGFTDPFDVYYNKSVTEKILTNWQENYASLT